MRDDSRTPKQVPLKTLLISALVVLLIAVWLVWWQSDALVARICEPLLADAASRAELLSGAEAASVEEGEPDLAADEAARLLEAVEQRWTELRGVAPSWPADLSSPQECDEVHQDLLALCRDVDSRPYVSERLQGGSICAVMREAAEELAASPPTLSSELKSYATILANVFHLSRTLGRKRVELLRDAMQEERELLEPAAMVLYRWAISREKCAQQTAIRPEQLYEYSGFLLQTVGGQAYLRRRSPDLEGLITFYALMVLDTAIEDGFNPQGVDPRPDIARCRELLAAQPLLFRERYLDLLDDMAQRWEERGG